MISSILTDTGKKKKKKKGKNQAAVSPDHYPLSTAFTNHIKARLVKIMLQRTRKKNKLDGIDYSIIELALLG